MIFKEVNLDFIVHRGIIWNFLFQNGDFNTEYMPIILIIKLFKLYIIGC